MDFAELCYLLELLKTILMNMTVVYLKWGNINKTILSVDEMQYMYGWAFLADVKLNHIQGQSFIM